jgi:hypothetical protein
MPTLIVTRPIGGEFLGFKCSDCEEVFSPPSVPRWAKPWTLEEARAKVAGQFQDHVEKAHREVKS